MIKRSTSDIKLIERRFPEQSKEFLEKIKSRQPEYEDLKGAVAGLLRLQTIYRLKSEDFASGIIDGKKTRADLSPHDLFVIGQEAYKSANTDYYVREYLQLVLDKIKKGLDVDKEVNENLLVLILCGSYNRTGDYAKALVFAETLIVNNPTEEGFVDLRDSLLEDQSKFGITKLEKTNPFSDDYKKDGHFRGYKEEILYSQLCRGAVTKSPKEVASLKCRYISNSPFSKLAPFKVEEMNHDPYLVLFLDVLTDLEIKYLKAASKSRIQRATTIEKNLERKISNSRIAQFAWHHDKEHQIIRRISKRVEVCLVKLHINVPNSLNTESCES